MSKPVRMALLGLFLADVAREEARLLQRRLLWGNQCTSFSGLL
jgi:hypothetical protein